MTAPGMPGIWPALMTPLAADHSIDHAKFAAHARGLIAKGCGGVTPFGTTGEGTSFSVAERIEAIDAMVAQGVPARQILVSVSCAALPDTIALTRHAQRIGAWGVLLMPPFFFKNLADEGVVAAIDEVLRAVPDPALRVVLYHIPQFSGVPLTVAAITEIVRRHGQRIAAIKDSAGDLDNSLAYVRAFMPKLGVHVGHELHLPQLAAAGSRGAVSGVANFMPRAVHRLATEPDATRTADDLARMRRLLDVLRAYPIFAALKAIVAAQTGDRAWLRVRAPLVALDDARFDALQRELAPLGIDPERD